jgi:hypothetical protein
MTLYALLMLFSLNGKSEDSDQDTVGRLAFDSRQGQTFYVLPPCPEQIWGWIYSFGGPRAIKMWGT